MPKHAATGAPKPIIPRQRYRPPAARLSPGSIVHLRNEIRCKNLIHRLQSFALDDPDNPKATRMTRTQAMVALSLLRKALPDMQALEISGNQDQPITVQVLRFADPDAHDISLQPHDSVQNGPSLIGNGAGEPLTIDITPRLIDDPDEHNISPRRTRRRKRDQ